MQVAMYYANRDVRLEEADAPEVGPGDVRIRIDSRTEYDGFTLFTVSMEPAVGAPSIDASMAESARSASFRGSPCALTTGSNSPRCSASRLAGHPSRSASNVAQVTLR